MPKNKHSFMFDLLITVFFAQCLAATPPAHQCLDSRPVEPACLDRYSPYKTSSSAKAGGLFSWTCVFESQMQ